MLELARVLHLIAMAFFVGGQLILAIVMVPAFRNAEPGPLDIGRRVILRNAARRFGYGSLVALGVLAVTGAAMAGEFGRWDDGTLHAKLALVALVGALIWAHTKRADRHALAGAILVASLAIVWLGVRLAH